MGHFQDPSRARARARARRQNAFCSRNTYKPAMYGIPRNDPFWPTFWTPFETVRRPYQAFWVKEGSKKCPKWPIFDPFFGPIFWPLFSWNRPFFPRFENPKLSKNMSQNVQKTHFWPFLINFWSIFWSHFLTHLDMAGNVFAKKRVFFGPLKWPFLGHFWVTFWTPFLQNTR